MRRTSSRAWRHVSAGLYGSVIGFCYSLAHSLRCSCAPVYLPSPHGITYELLLHSKSSTKRSEGFHLVRIGLVLYMYDVIWMLRKYTRVYDLFLSLSPSLPLSFSHSHVSPLFLSVFFTIQNTTPEQCTSPSVRRHDGSRMPRDDEEEEEEEHHHFVSSALSYSYRTKTNTK